MSVITAGPDLVRPLLKCTGMNNFFRALIAGYGAKKLGGGCLGTVLVFIIIWVALGQCSWSERNEIKVDPIPSCEWKNTYAPTDEANNTSWHFKIV